MGIFFNRDILNELQLNGQELGDSNDNATNTTDYTADQGQDNAAAADNPAEAPEDYTVPDQGEEQTPEEADNNPQEEGTEAGDQTETDDAGDQTTDYTADNTGDAPAEGGEEGAPAEGGEDAGDDTGDDDGGDDYNDDVPDDDQVKQLEDELFSRFNDQQIAIMNTDLKKKYIELYDLLDTSIERINDIPKEDRFIRMIGFVTKKLADVRDMINDYLITTYTTKSFIENQINYKRFCVTINQLNMIIEQIYPSKEEK